MQTNEALITNFFQDYRHNQTYGQMSSMFIFDTLADLAHNKDISPDFMFHKRNPYDRYQPYQQQSYSSNPDNMHTRIKSFIGS